MLTGSVSWEVVVDVGMCINYPSSLTRAMICAGGGEVLPDRVATSKDSVTLFHIF